MGWRVLERGAVASGVYGFVGGSTGDGYLGVSWMIVEDGVIEGIFWIRGTTLCV